MGKPSRHRSEHRKVIRRSPADTHPAYAAVSDEPPRQRRTTGTAIKHDRSSRHSRGECRGGRGERARDNAGRTGLDKAQAVGAVPEFGGLWSGRCSRQVHTGEAIKAHRIAGCRGGGPFDKGTSSHRCGGGREERAIGAIPGVAGRCGVAGGEPRTACHQRSADTNHERRSNRTARAAGRAREIPGEECAGSGVRHPGTKDQPSNRSAPEPTDDIGEPMPANGYPSRLGRSRAAPRHSEPVGTHDEPSHDGSPVNRSRPHRHPGAEHCVYNPRQSLYARRPGIQPRGLRLQAPTATATATLSRAALEGSGTAATAPDADSS